MTRVMKVSFVLSAILGMAAGAGFGYSQGAQLGESMRSLEPVGAAFAVSDFASRQFYHADVEHARQAALLEIRSVRRQLRAVEHDSAVDGGLGLAYVRLAMVEEQPAIKKPNVRLWSKQEHGSHPRVRAQSRATSNSRTS